MNRDSKKLETGRVTKMFVTRGVSKSEITSATAGTFQFITSAVGIVR